MTERGRWGTTYDQHLGEAHRARHRDALIARAAANIRDDAVAAAARPCTCPHPQTEHDGDEGCLHGWGAPPRNGCPCLGNTKTRT